MRQKNAFYCSFALILIVFSLVPVIAQTDRYFDAVPVSGRPLTLVALHPDDGTVKTVIALRNAGLLPQQNMIVVGVYHDQELTVASERTDYNRAHDIIEKGNLDWFQFHVVTGYLEPDNLFEENACSEDFRKIFEGCDGILFFGGADIPPGIYGEDTQLLTEVTTPYRHFFEVSFAFHLLGAYRSRSTRPFLAERPTLPVMGLCLGCQTLNVGAGGTLIQDIPSDIYHFSTLEQIIGMPADTWHRSPFPALYPGKQLAYFWLHPVKLLDGSLFCREWKFLPAHRPYVYSSHHQAIKKLGKGFRVAATSIDGKVIEAVEHDTYPNVLGVQFHPEAVRIWSDSKYKYRPEDQDGTPISAILEQNPPSMLFHKLLWAWFTTELYKYHNAYAEQAQPAVKLP